MNYKTLANRLTCAMLFIGTFYVHDVYAQACGSDMMQQRMWQQHPELAAQAQVNTQHWDQYMQRVNSSLIVNTTLGPEYEIPLVIHIMNTGNAIGGLYNPTDVQIDSLVSYVNQTYAATWSAYPDTNSGGVRIPIRFVLAKRDPSCNPTTGIIRYNASGLAGYTAYGVKDATANGPSDSAVKSLSIWPPEDYVNVWIVNKIDGNDGTLPGVSYIAGFAYLPPVPRYLDGVIMLANQVNAGSITLPHELGHVLGLYHTFQGGNTTTCPPFTNNCNVDNDEVCDTQPEMQSNFNCPSGTNPCSSTGYLNVQHNFMDYSSCQDRFTAGQDTRILYKLLNLRPGLLSSLGGVAPAGTSVAAASCTPGIINPGNQYDIGPTKVVLNDLQANSGGYNDDGNISYRDESCVQRANLVTGRTYTLSVTVGAYNSENVAAWIDYNNDGIFQSSELVLTGTGIAIGGTATATITLPAGVVTCVPLRMRVMSDFAGVAAPANCTSLQYGQTEDYSVYITNPSSASVALTTGTNPGCLGATRTFTASSVNLGTATGYNWYVNNTLVSTNTPTYSISTLANGDSVWVKAYATTAGCWAADTIKAAAIHMALSATVTTPTAGGNGPLCSGSTINLTSSTVTGAIYSWSGPNGYSAITQNPTIPNATTANSGTYSVIASTASCISNPGNVMVVINATPTTPVVGSNSPVCVSSPITLTASSTAGATYSWTGPSYTSSAQNPIIANAQLANAGTYSVKASANGCTSAAGTVTVIVGTSPAAPAASSNSPVCAGTALNLTASAIAGVTYSWTGPGGYTSTVQNPVIASAQTNNSGTYSVKAHLGTCVSAASNNVTVVVNPLPAVPVAGSNSPLCAGAALDLTAATIAGTTYGWAGPGGYTSSTQNPVIANAQTTNSGRYIVKATATTGGCSSADTISVTVNANVTPTVTLTPSVATAGQNTNFTASVTNGGAAATYTWITNGGIVPGAADSVYNVTLQKGDTLCSIVYSSASCASPDTVMACIYPTLAASSIQSLTGDLRLYPNPNDGSFTIYGTIGNSKKATIEVLNILGQVVYKEDADVQNNLLNRQVALGGVSAGTYILKVSTETDSKTIKLTVQK